MEEGREPISNIQWGLVIGALIVVDAIEFLITLFGVGLIVNSFIDIAVGFFFGLWLQMHGQSFTSTRRLAAFVGTFILEFIPAVDALPWWTIDGFYNRHLERRREAGKSEGVVAAAANVANRSKGGPTAGATRGSTSLTPSGGIARAPSSTPPNHSLPPSVDAIRAKT